SCASAWAATFIAERSMKFAACDWAFSRLNTSSRKTGLSCDAAATNASRASGGCSSACSSSASTCFHSSRSILVIAEFAIEPRLGFVPLAYDSDGRHLHDFRSFLDTKSAKETQLDDATLAFINRGEVF